MKKSILPTVFCTVLAFIALVCAPESMSAQRGGHGGGGGFHGGGGYSAYGGGGGFHSGGGYSAYGGGGHFYGGYHGGGYYGGRGGYYGSHGGYWGYPRYGYGWGFGIGFGWGSYWPTYPYAYGYSQWWGAPSYYYPYSYYSYPPAGYAYPYPYAGGSSASPSDYGSNFYENSPARLPSASAPANSRASSLITNVAATAPAASNYRTNATTGTASHFRLASTNQQPPPPRREVQNVILALRAMPPDARQRQIDSDRYNSFSFEERELLRNASQFPPAW